MRTRFLPFLRVLAAVVCLIGWVAQGGVARAQTPAPAPSQAPSEDPLGRDSPFGTVTGFSRAVHSGDFAVASRYLQLRGRQAESAEALARDLNALLDRYYTQPLTRLSSSPAGNQKDGLDPDHEQISLLMGTDTYHVMLERVADPDAGRIWLFSSRTLSDVPRLAASEQLTRLERSMPASLTARSLWGLSLAQWAGWTVSLVGPMVFLFLVGNASVFLIRRLWHGGTRDVMVAKWWLRLRWPLVVSIALIVHLLLVRNLGFSLQFRYTYSRMALAVAVVFTGLLLWRLVTLTFGQAESIALRRGRAGAQSLLLLAERITKVALALAALLGLLALAGLDLTTALAGVGIIGVALAFGAQKTVENLLGGVFLLTDRVLAVGDYCRLSDHEGWIEDITLRSVRLRTLQQTLVSVPAGILSQSSIENYSTRNKMLIQSRLTLRYDASVDQIQRVLEGTRRLLASDSRLEQASARIRLVDFGANGVELELFAFAETGNPLQFLEIREQLLLRIASIVESVGGAFAAPPQFVYGSATPANAGVAGSS